MKYKLAYSRGHNCDDTRGHIFQLVNDDRDIKAIREQHPKLTAALWECTRCGKVKESM